MTNAARFTINGTPSEDSNGDRGYQASLSQSLLLTLEDNPSQALSVRYSVYDPADALSPLASKDSPLLTFTGSGTSSQILTAVNDSVELVMPGTGIHSWLVRCVVTTANGSETFERMVSLRTVTSPPLRKLIPNETGESEARGFADQYNELLDFMNGVIVPSGTIVTVNTLNDLRSLNLGLGRVNEIVSILGYANPRDGGEGLFRWVNDPSLADNDGTIVSSPVANYYFVRLYEPGTWSSRWFGHHPDNLYTDNDTIIDNIMSFITTGMTLYVPGGIYKHKLFDIVTENLTIRFDAGTWIKLPDEGVGVGEYQVRSIAGALLSGISTNNIDRVTLINVKYDGNCEDHRSYLETLYGTYPELYNVTAAFGFYFGIFNEALPARVTAKQITMINCRADNVITGNIVYGDDVHIDGLNCSFKNCPINHLHYCSLTPGGENTSIWTNLTLEGYWRSSAVVSQGCTYNGIIVKNVVANPTNAVTGYILETIIETRGGDNLKPNRFTQVDFRGISPDLVLRAFYIRSDTLIQNVTLEQRDASKELFYLIELSTNTANTEIKHLLVDGYEIQGVHSEKFRILYLVGNTEYARNLFFRSGYLKYAELNVAVPRNVSLFNLAAPCSNVVVDGLRIDVDSTRLISTDSGKDISNVVFKNVEAFAAYPPHNGVVINPGAYDIVMKNCKFTSAMYIDPAFFGPMRLQDCQHGTKYTNNEGLYESADNLVAVSSFSFAHSLINDPDQLVPPVTGTVRGYISITPHSEYAAWDGTGPLSYYVTSDANNLIVTFDRPITTGVGQTVKLFWRAAVTRYRTTAN